MGLDASVYCDCFERGRLRTPPRPNWRVSVDPTGARVADPNPDSREEQFAFIEWDRDACEHPGGTLLHHWLGNISGVAEFRDVLSETVDQFPVILSKVIYSGSHCGDILPVDQLPALAGEVARLTSVFPADPKEAELFRLFERKMRELVEAATRVGKPIVF